MFLLASCPSCHRLKITIHHPDQAYRRLRAHKVREPDRPIAELALMPRCPGSLSTVELGDLVTL